MFSVFRKLSIFTKLHCLKLICKVQIPRNPHGSAQKVEARVTPDKPQGLVKPRSEMGLFLLAVPRALGTAGRQRGAAGAGQGAAPGVPVGFLSWGDG